MVHQKNIKLPQTKYYLWWGIVCEDENGLRGHEIIDLGFIWK